MSRTVLIVDDHAVFRAAARALLEAEGFVVVGEAADSVEAISAVRILGPAVVLLDIQLPGRDGFDVAEELAEGPHPPALVLVSGRDPAMFGPRLRRTSARGFLAKSELSGPALAGLLD
jgi:DNA-binding NarL/FixJ family response regulator